MNGCTGKRGYATKMTALLTANARVKKGDSTKTLRIYLCPRCNLYHLTKIVSKGETMRGLIFSTPMVKAWMAGRKDVTRRLIKFNIAGRVQRGGKQWHIDDPNAYLAARYTPGETVYIKETWAPVGEIARKAIELAKKWPYGPVSLPEYEGPDFIYKADWDAAGKKYVNKWKSPRFMPEWSARSHARIVSVRPERIQEIHHQANEFLREGFCLPKHELYPSVNTADKLERYFLRAWDTLHPGSWERNDFVWRIELKKIEKEAHDEAP